MIVINVIYVRAPKKNTSLANKSNNIKKNHVKSINLQHYIDIIHHIDSAQYITQSNVSGQYYKTIDKAKYLKHYDQIGIYMDSNIVMRSNIDLQEQNIAIQRILFSKLITDNHTMHFKSNKMQHNHSNYKVISNLNVNTECINLMVRSHLVSQFLSDLPPNICTPEFFEQVVKYDLSKEDLDIDVQYLSKQNIQNLPLINAVGKGSVNKPRVIILSRGNPISCIVAKGITYDSGGLNLKTTMQTHMGKDMIGAAVAYAVAKMLAYKKVNNFAIAIMLAENMPDGNAYRPGDIYFTRSGKSVFIENTDAEGRLVMADGIELLQEKFQKLRNVITLSTLTGLALMTLGPDYFVAMSYSKHLKKCLQKASLQYNNKYWVLPFLSKSMSHHIADVTNHKDGFGGISDAAKFLKYFVKNHISFMYLDIAAAIFRPDVPDARLLTELIELINQKT